MAFIGSVQRASDEIGEGYRAECTCGWAGEICKGVMAASREKNIHMAEHE